jgi:hypothetical protein
MKGDSPNGRPFYTWQMVAPTGLMFFIAPEVAATMLLVLGENVVSTFGYQHQIAYHYSMVILPTLWMGTVYAISKLKTPRWRTIAISIVGVSALWSSYLWGAFPFNTTYGHWSPSSPEVAQINQVKDKVPPNATIATYYSYAPHLDHRKRIYMWPTPFHAVYWNTFRQEGECLPIANDVQYVMLPKPLSDNVPVWDAIKDHFQVVAQSDNSALYKRTDPTTDICEPLVAANASSR